MKLKHLSIIGLGSIGRRHLRLLKELRPDLELTLVRTGIGGAWPEEKLATRTVESLEQAIDLGIQAAIISSPANMHVQQARELINAGIHILVEKPLSNSFDGVDELLREISKSGVTGIIGYSLRYDPAAEKFLAVLRNGVLGKILHVRIECGSYLPDWRPEQDYRNTVSSSMKLGGGVLFELSHELDYISWFFGKIKSIQANLHNSGTLDIDVEDCADLIITNENDVPISAHLDFSSRYPKRVCIVQSVRGELTWDVIKRTVTWNPKEGDTQLNSFDVERDLVYKKQLEHFLDCIENGAVPKVTLGDGARVLRLIEAARRSHENGWRVMVA